MQISPNLILVNLKPVIIFVIPRRLRARHIRYQDLTPAQISQARAMHRALFPDPNWVYYSRYSYPANPDKTLLGLVIWTPTPQVYHLAFIIDQLNHEIPFITWWRGQFNKIGHNSPLLPFKLLFNIMSLNTIHNTISILHSQSAAFHSSNTNF